MARRAGAMILAARLGLASCGAPRCMTHIARLRVSLMPQNPVYPPVPAGRPQKAVAVTLREVHRPARGPMSTFAPDAVYMKTSALQRSAIQRPCGGMRRLACQILLPYQVSPFLIRSPR
jgi:hypothetical protein